MKPSHGKALLSAAATLVALAFAELLLHRLSPPVLIGVGTDKTDKSRIYGWCLEPFERYPFINPDSGIVTYFNANSRGWKDVEHEYAKPDGRIRILCIGDSGTYGLVDLKDLYTRRIEEILHRSGQTNIEVISIGVGAWGTDQELEALKDDGMRYKPDIVIYQFCGNDITDNVQPTADTPPDSIFQRKPFNYRVCNDALIKIPRHLPPRKLSPVTSIKRALLHSALIYNINNVRKRVLQICSAHFSRSSARSDPAVDTLEKRNSRIKAARTEMLRYTLNPDNPYYIYTAGVQPNELNEAWNLLEKLIVEMDAIARKDNARFLVFSEESEEGKRQWGLAWGRMHTDQQGDYVLKDGRRYPCDWKRPLKNLRMICENNAIPLIEPQRPYARYINDPHPNAEGNMAMAMDIVEYLQNSRVIK